MVTVRWLYIKQRRERKCGRIPCNLHLEAEKVWLRKTTSHGDSEAELPGRGAAGARARGGIVCGHRTSWSQCSRLESAQGRAVGYKAGA